MVLFITTTKGKKKEVVPWTVQSKSCNMLTLSGFKYCFVIIPPLFLSWIIYIRIEIIIKPLDQVTISHSFFLPTLPVQVLPCRCPVLQACCCSPSAWTWPRCRSSSLPLGGSRLSSASCSGWGSSRYRPESKWDVNIHYLLSKVIYVL